MRAEKRLSPESIRALKAEIEDAGGNEVFALGYCGGGGLVTEIKIRARGDGASVLAPGALDFSGDSGRVPNVIIHNHPSGFLTPSDNDLIIASRAAESGVGSYIVDNGVSRVYAVAEPVLNKGRTQIDPEKLCAFLENKLGAKLPVYEKRQGQLDLLRLAAGALNGDLLAAAEAGTGVGKSFAYILPALEYALANRERIVISTATITLQQQLYEKDIPLTVKALNKKIRVSLVKGRANYLCLRRLGDVLMEGTLDDAEYEGLRALTAWSESTKTGTLSELPFSPPEGLWSRVCSEADTCMGLRCPLREGCFFLKLRRESAEALILVVNHHLLFADLAARHQGAGYDTAVVLPPYTRVIIDEAHNIEGAATSFFSRELSRLGIIRTLGRLYRKRRGREGGLLVRLAGRSAGNIGEEILNALAGVREWAEKADAAALSLCGDGGPCRLVPGENGEFLETVLFPPLAELRRSIGVLAGRVRSFAEPAENAASEAEKEDTALWELRSVLRRLETAGALCASFIEYGGNDGEVFCIERKSGRGTSGSPGNPAFHAGDPWALLSAVPIDIAPVLRDALFEPNKTVICVSATLSVGRGFSYWAGRTGAALSGRELVTGLFPSPFPYACNTLLAVPSDGPLPGGGEGDGEYQEFVNRAVKELILVSGGSALVLFTSYQSLKSAFAASAAELESSGIRCLKQGDDDRSRLLAAFLADRSCVLFATDSFWEGVDAPGETLRMVILCRLPFRTPRDPVFEARRERIEKRGGNAFMELSLPDAVMKFKQGFGRLMRRSGDFGVVAVPDSRILHKFYGKVFLNSLPETKRSFKELPSVLRDVEDFLYSRGL
jgi:ATP-dependent DNA helicase DinG